MSGKARFTLVYAPETIDHMMAIERKYHRLIRDTLKQQLSYTPGAETRNRKPLEPAALSGATWELRLGPNNRFRVFYSIKEAERIVEILAIGIKDGNRIRVAGEEWNL